MAKRTNKGPVPKHHHTHHEHFQQGNIGLIIDTYDDLFSDFDPRVYSERAVSDDFVFECSKAIRESTDDQGVLELRILVPKKIRHAATEQIIKRRMQSHFKKQLHERIKERKHAQWRGSLFAVFGAALIYVATLLYSYQGMLYDFLRVLTEPAGWFTVWQAYDLLFFGANDKKQEVIFYKRMSNIKIHFKGY